MTQDELINRIQILTPNTKCSVWPLDGDYYGDQDPIERCGFRVCWSVLNTNPCPTEDQLNSVTQQQLDNYIQQVNDNNLYNQYKDDVSMKALYNNAKQINSTLTFIDFLKSVQSTKV